MISNFFRVTLLLLKLPHFFTSMPGTKSLLHHQSFVSFSSVMSSLLNVVIHCCQHVEVNSSKKSPSFVITQSKQENIVISFLFSHPVIRQGTKICSNNNHIKNWVFEQSGKNGLVESSTHVNQVSNDRSYIYHRTLCL